ncbi:MAG: YkoF family thiamine/hydroxymethylpyrimidine-binding protein [Bacteroidota bacterium]
MQVAVEISYYPLLADYEPPIIAFIEGLKTHPGLTVATNQLSTQVSGDYDEVMSAIQSEIKKSLQNGPKASFVLKVLNVDIEPGQVIM